jgi:glycosyltransferase involved in cell wall biosynthesis
VGLIPLVSIITPTGRRDALLQLQHANVLRQTLQDFEWLILDDSPQPSSHFTALTDPRIRYRHQEGPRLTIGEKRNRLIAEAKGGIIAHFDDDDFYTPRYLEFMAARLAAGADAAKFTGFFVYGLSSQFLGYWDVPATRGLHRQISSAPGIKYVDFGPQPPQLLEDSILGFGFSYVYRRAVWEKVPFTDQNLSEDRIFLKSAHNAGFKLDIFPDTEGLALVITGGPGNISACFPQYSLPSFMLTRIFGPRVLPMLVR